MATQVGGLSNNGAVPRMTQGFAPSQSLNLNQANASGGLTPLNSGLLDMHKPTTPVISKTDAQGNTVKFAQPKTTGTPTGTGGTTQTTGTPATPPTVYQGMLTDYGKSIGATDPNATPPPTLPAGAAGAATGGSNTGSTGVNQGVLIANLADKSQNLSPAYTDASNTYQGLLSQYNKDLLNYNTNSAGLGNQLGIPQGFATGREAQYQALNSGRLSAEATGVNAALGGLNAANTAVGQQIGAATGALGANAPITGVPYGTQTINPATGQPYGQTGGVSVDPNNPVASIPNLAQAVVDGRMTIDQANTALGGGVGLTTNLRSQILAKNPNFNFTQSSASAATQAVGQQVNTFATSANSALDKLTTDFANLPDWQKLGIPGTIGIEQALGNFFGNDKLSTYKTTLHDARAQLSGVLSTAGGMTPTSAGDTAQTYLPDNMTKDQLVAKIAAAKALVAQKVQAFQQSGVQNGTSTNTSSGGVTFGWNG